MTKGLHVQSVHMNVHMQMQGAHALEPLCGHFKVHMRLQGTNLIEHAGDA